MEGLSHLLFSEAHQTQSFISHQRHCIMPKVLALPHVLHYPRQPVNEYIVTFCFYINVCVKQCPEYLILPQYLAARISSRSSICVGDFLERYL
jgi:hypothetical protein